MLIVIQTSILIFYPFNNSSGWWHWDSTSGYRGSPNRGILQDPRVFVFTVLLVVDQFEIYGFPHIEGGPFGARNFDNGNWRVGGEFILWVLLESGVQDQNHYTNPTNFTSRLAPQTITLLYKVAVNVELLVTHEM